jgi:two-component system, NarL family, nitrate/nitrite response regulator NarL
MVSSLIRVVVADNHPNFRSGLILTLNAQDDMVVVGHGETAEEAAMLAADLKPDLVLLDLNMPGNGIAAAAMIAKLRPDARSVIMTAQADEEALEGARRAGAHGYILKGVTARDLVRMLRQVCEHGSAWPNVRVAGWAQAVS